MCICYEKPKVRDHILEGGFGLEKESLRVNKEGFLSHTKHPFPQNKNIERDFCENQVEIITDVCSSPEELYLELLKLQKQVFNKLWNMETGREYLWQFSNPPYVKGEEDILIATYEGELKEKEVYRKYLAEKYGKKKMLFSGIHFNFSFSDELLKYAYNNKKEKSFRDFKNNLYLELAKKVAKYSWFLVYITAASPMMDASFFNEAELGKDVKSKYASYRCSNIGYWNDFVPVLNYETIEKYIKSIERYIAEGKLKSAAELYYPVRLKPNKENSLENLLNYGINHIELRMIDLNPLSKAGIFKEDIKFIHYFLIYLSSLPSITFNDKEQIIAIKNMKNAAYLDEEKIFIENNNMSKNILEEGISLLEDMDKFYKKLEITEARELIKKQKEKFQKPKERYAKNLEKLYMEDYVKKGIKLVDSYSREYIS